MSEETAERSIKLHDVIHYTLQKILAANKCGLTVRNLNEELLSFSRTTRLPVFLGLDQGGGLSNILDDYVKRGKFKYEILTVGVIQTSRIVPTDKFKFEIDEAIEEAIKQFFVVREEVVIRDNTPDTLRR